MNASSSATNSPFESCFDLEKVGGYMLVILLASNYKKKSSIYLTIN